MDIILRCVSIDIILGNCLMIILKKRTPPPKKKKNQNFGKQKIYENPADFLIQLLPPPRSHEKKINRNFSTP